MGKIAVSFVDGFGKCEGIVVFPQDILEVHQLMAVDNADEDILVDMAVGTDTIQLGGTAIQILYDKNR